MFPAEWSVCSVGELFDCLRTASNSRADLDDTGDVAYVHYGDIHTRFNHFIDFARDSVPRLSADRSVTAALLRDGDLIVADASQDESGVGKSVEIRNLGATKAVSGLHTLLLRSKDRRTPEGYRGYLLENRSVKEQLRCLATGLKVYGISRGALKRVLVPLPPSSEQNVIAEALSDVDGLLGALEALIHKKRLLRQAAMQQLLTGKARLPGFNGEWGAKRIADIADVDPENLSDSTKPDSRFNYISLVQVDAGDLLGNSEVEFRTAPSRARRVFRSGDVLMSTVRPNLMGHMLYSEQIPNAICSTGFAVLRAKPRESDPRFLFAHLFGQAVTRQIEQTLSGSNYPAISSRDVRQFEIIFPSEISEQSAIADVLTDMDAEIAALERRRDKMLAVKQGMTEPLLTGRVRLV